MANTPIALPKQKRNNDRRTWHGLAFTMEALILLIFLIISIAVLMQVFNTARTHAQHADSLSRSVTLASNEAELFNSNPEENTETYFVVNDGTLVKTEKVTEDSFVVSRTVTSESTGSGTLYHATIVVERNSIEVYKINSARYVCAMEVAQ